MLALRLWLFYVCAMSRVGRFYRYVCVCVCMCVCVCVCVCVSVADGLCW